MNYEIERKFLVKDQSWKEGLNEADSSFIQQAYLSVYPEPTVRVRAKDSHAWLTIKGKSEGIGRPEYEYSIPVQEAMELIKMAVSAIVLKRRYEVKYQNKLWEIDEFYGDNEGLIIAEIELDKEDEKFEAPAWAGEDVSMDPRYKNFFLASNPFKSWK